MDVDTVTLAGRQNEEMSTPTQNVYRPSLMVSFLNQYQRNVFCFFFGNLISLFRKCEPALVEIRGYKKIDHKLFNRFKKVIWGRGSAGVQSIGKDKVATARQIEANSSSTAQI